MGNLKKDLSKRDQKETQKDSKGKRKQKTSAEHKLCINLMKNDILQ